MTVKTYLCKDEDLVPNAPLQVCSEGRDAPYALFRINGHVYLTDDLCTHGLAPLSAGDLNGHEINCPLHGGAFDVRSGKATELPCKRAIKTYQVEMVDEAIYGLID